MELRDRIAARFFQNQEYQKDEEMRSMMRDMIRTDGEQREISAACNLCATSANIVTQSLYMCAGKPYVATELKLPPETIRQQSLKLQVTDGFLDGKNDELREFTQMYLKQDLNHQNLYHSVVQFFTQRVADLLVLWRDVIQPPAEHDEEPE